MRLGFEKCKKRSLKPRYGYKAAFGGLDALLINAGMGGFYPIEAACEADFDQMMAVNLKGPFFLIRALSSQTVAVRASV